MKKNLKNQIPFIAYIILILYIFKDYTKNEIFNANEFLYDAFASFKSLFFYLGLYISLNIYFNRIDFLNPIYFLRYRENKFEKMYKHYAYSAIFSIFKISMVVAIFWIVLNYKFNTIFISIITNLSIFIISQYIFFLRLYLTQKSQLTSIIALLIFNIICLMINNHIIFLGIININSLTSMTKLIVFIAIIGIVIFFSIDRNLKERELI